MGEQHCCGKHSYTGDKLAHATLMVNVLIDRYHLPMAHEYPTFHADVSYKQSLSWHSKHRQLLSLS
jgi:hypothetical protein